jgi:glycosyltransferase involved in cell wall biosynthesis
VPEPGVSVVVPVRDGARYLAEALRSVAAQTLPPLEVIVVDDGSSDHSPALAAAAGAQVVRQPPGGQAAARNRGVELARGELVAFLDADDLWPADKLEGQAAALGDMPAVGVCFGQVSEFLSPDVPPEVAPPLRFVAEPRPGWIFGAMVARRAALERVGPFSSEWRVGELLDWMLRAKDAGVEVLTIPRLVLHRRLHAHNTSRRERASRGDLARILKRALDRRRPESPPRGLERTP